MPIRLRVITGTAGGLFLKSPKKHLLRPTQDRIRQVVFSSLGNAVIDADVLDLYAGTGTYGIEALSRGAASACFIEQNAEAVQCIRDNLAHCKLQGRVIQGEVGVQLAKMSENRYNLIFSDPPYRKNDEVINYETLLEPIGSILAEEGILVWEYYAGQRVENLAGWEILRNRCYGETGLIFLKKSL